MVDADRTGRSSGGGDTTTLPQPGARFRHGGTPQAAKQPAARRAVGHISETARLHWQASTKLGRISLAGIAVSALMALTLGSAIPSIVEDHALDARLEGVESLVSILEDQDLIPPATEHLSGDDYTRFDRIVHSGLLGGINLRLKLWNRAGEIVYSDQRRLVGERFPVSETLLAALAGRPAAEVAEPTDVENRLDADIGRRFLEFYVPLEDDAGRTIGVFEVYQSIDSFAAHMGDIRRSVWIAVATVLVVLLVFLVSLFAGTAGSMARDKRDAEERASQLAALVRSAKSLSEDPLLRVSGQSVLQEIADDLDLGCCAIVIDGPSGNDVILPPDGHTDVCRICGDAGKEVARTQRAQIRPGIPATVEGYEGRCSLIGVPFRAADVAGALVACRPPDRPLQAEEAKLFSAVATQIGVAAESSKLFDDLLRSNEQRRHLSRRLVTAQEEERRHLVGELHDGLGQKLTRVLYGLRGARGRLDGRGGEVAAELAHLEDLIEEGSSELRRYMSEIRPPQLDRSGLAAVIRSFAREQEAESGLRIDADVDGLGDVGPTVSVTVFRAVQETVMNARKHADASRVNIDLRRSDGHVILDVRDDGRGLDEPGTGIGLSYLRDRVSSLDGTVEIVGKPGDGTSVHVVLPLRERDAG